MKFSENWLRELVDLQGISHDEVVERLTMSGLEVDDVAAVAADFDDVVVARIESTEPHPDADKLRVCRVNDGTGTQLQIVCGAPNARPGLVAPLARLGASLPGITIKKARLRGVESNGMLCSGRELGLTEDHDGLLELAGDAPIGRNFREYLELDDTAIEVDLTPNRADCLGMIGLAQDAAAMFGRDTSLPDITPIPARNDSEKSISLQAPEDCARYAGRMILGIDATARTPRWMAEKLRRSGLKLFNPVVDVTNYVLLELGQPMHGFDADKLQGGISVRRARKGEKLTLLTDAQVEVDERFLLICDESGPVALGGVMGGLSTSVTEETTNVFFECAWFAPDAIVGRARALGLTTDAAHRYERGVDPDLQISAIERATELLISIAGGEPGPISVAESPENLPQRKPVSLRYQRIARLLGTTIERDEVAQILTSLGMQLAETDTGWNVIAPTRRFDIEIEEDLIEEVVRVYGYDRLPGRHPEGAIPAVHLPEQALAEHDVRCLLSERGFNEAITYSFISEAMAQPLGEATLPLGNPLSAELAHMRPSLVPGLLGALASNLNRQLERVRLFEVGVVFRNPERLTERNHVAAVAVGPAFGESWSNPSDNMDFFDMKNVVESVLSMARRTDVRFEPSSRTYLHPGQSAEVILGNESAGWIGALHPTFCKGADIDQRVFAFELDLDRLQPVPMPRLATLSKFPSVRRDVALIVEEDVSWQQIQTIVAETCGNLLTRQVVFDEYKGPGVAEGKKSLAFGLTFSVPDRTLTDSEIDATMAKVVNALRQSVGGELRGQE